jgi:poly-gamma-glutamate capsule biosynthesis protein CapA/YwtB (metallophosphatase superfamily)
MTSIEVLLAACGDIGPLHEPGAGGYVAASTATALAAADLRFAQCERLYSTRGALQLGSGGGHTRLDPAMARVFADYAFDVVSVASNHSLDWGPDALLDTIDTLEAQGIRTVGAGRTIEEARRPVVLERKGVRIAFLAYCSVLREGYAAGPSSPGVAPLRASTSYEQFDFQAGVAPRIVTVPHVDDLAAMRADVTRAAAEADVVVMSVHWGIHFVPRVTADYERLIAQAAFDSGADVIVGHHPHLPKAVASYGGKVCFHSLGNFLMSIPEPSAERIEQMFRDYGVRPDPVTPRVPFGPDGRRSLIGKIRLARDGVRRVGFQPVLIDEQLRPEALTAGDERFAEMVRYLDWASDGFAHEFRVDGDEVLIGD